MVGNLCSFSTLKEQPIRTINIQNNKDVKFDMHINMGFLDFDIGLMTILQNQDYLPC